MTRLASRGKQQFFDAAGNSMENQKVVACVQDIFPFLIGMNSCPFHQSAQQREWRSQGGGEVVRAAIDGASDQHRLFP